MKSIHEISAVVLAAGKSSRMGEDHKLLQSVKNKSVIRWVAEDLCSLPFKEVLAITGARATEVCGAMGSLSVRSVHNHDFAKGMHSSIVTAVKGLNPESLGMLIFLGDQPFQVAERAKRFFVDSELFENSLIRSVSNGAPGHPVFIGRNYFPEILSEPDSDRGCGYLFQRHPFQTVEQGEESVWDLDTPEDFNRLQSVLNQTN